MISYIIPTRGRQEQLNRTLDRIGALPSFDAEVIVVDNASDQPVCVPKALSNGINVLLHRLDQNLGAAARNYGADIARGRWLFMLDDDSYPLDPVDCADLSRVADDIGALHTDITLPDGTRERGGLPEVTVGCGMLVRRDVFTSLGGYDPAMGYYVEEYDLCARIIREGLRVASLPHTRVHHHKHTSMRSKVLILERLVRNNAWVARRYAPCHLQRNIIYRDTHRYREIANRESALIGYISGLRQYRATRRLQRHTPLTSEQWSRFCGATACLEQLGAELRRNRFATATIISPGKNVEIITESLLELGVKIVPNGGDVTVIGTLSPGPARDAVEAIVAGHLSESPIRIQHSEPRRVLAVLPTAAYSRVPIIA